MNIKRFVLKKNARRGDVQKHRTFRQFRQFEYKKAVVFTLIALLLAILFVSVFSIDATIRSADYEKESSRTRIRIMDSYVKNFDQYVENSIEISAHKTFESLYNLSITRGRFFSNANEFNTAFAGCMRCAYIDCGNRIPANACPAGMGSNSLEYLLGRITNLSYKDINVVTNYSITSITVYQQQPFDAVVDVSISYGIHDVAREDYASWNRNRTFRQSISLVGLFDPLAGVSTANVYVKPIKKTTTCLYNESCWNATTANAFYVAGEFRYHANGTSYLQRFWNDSSPSSCCGIESFINTSYVFGNNSYIDTRYWTGQYVCPSGANKIVRIDQIMDGGVYLHLDPATASKYGLSSVAVQSCPS